EVAALLSTMSHLNELSHRENEQDLYRLKKVEHVPHSHFAHVPRPKVSMESLALHSPT
ncbi:unnamed protein product, partial [Bubo scandiacus]